MKHHSKLKRGVALALSALCAVSLWANVGKALDSNEVVRLVYTNNYTWKPVETGKDENGNPVYEYQKVLDTTSAAEVLIGGEKSIQVQMTMGSTDLPLDSGKNKALTFSPREGTSSQLALDSDGAGPRGQYRILAELKDGTTEMDRPEQVNIQANINSITPPEGYKGLVSARSNAGGNTADNARLTTPQPITEKSEIQIECTRGETIQDYAPEFAITGTPTGIFAGYDTIALVPADSDLGMLSKRDKKITVLVQDTIVPAGETPKDDLTMWFIQPLTYTDIAAPTKDTDGTIYYVDETGKKCENQDVDERYHTQGTNNMFRVGTIYSLQFSPPTSDILAVQFATPEYVAKLIASNIQGFSRDQQGDVPYLQLEDDDRLTLITGDSITVTTYDFRYNDEFDIVWTWEPSTDTDKNPTVGENAVDMIAAKNAIDLPSPETGTEKKPTYTCSIHRQENDVWGTLTATVVYNKDRFLKDVETADGETVQVPAATASFDLMIRGSGISANVEPIRQYIGMPEGAVVVPDIDPDTGKAVNYPTPPYPQLAKTMPSTLHMDVFRGGIENYTRPAAESLPCDYVLRLNMGQKRARSAYAIATLEGDTDAVELFVEDNGVNQHYDPGTQILNPRPSDAYDGEGYADLTVRAMQPGKVTLKVEYYVELPSGMRVFSTHEMVITVGDSSPSTDSSLSALTLRDAGRKEPAIDFGFDPAKSSYTKPEIELPYVYESYNFTPVINDLGARDKEIIVTAWDSSGTPMDVFEGGEDGGLTSRTTVKSGNNLTVTLREDPDPDKNKLGKVIWIRMHVEAVDPRAYTDYELCVVRLRPSEDDTLKFIGVYAQEDTEGQNNLLTGFDPEQKYYIVTVPYSTKYLRVNATQNFPRALVAYDPELRGLTMLGAREYLDLSLDRFTDPGSRELVPDSGGVRLPCLHIRVTSEINRESGRSTGDYQVFINRLPPSEDSHMSALTIVDADDTSANPKALPYTPAYNMNNTGPYRLTDANAVPYSTKAVRFKITPQDELVSAIRIYNKDKTKLLTTIENPEVFSEPVSLVARSTDQLYNDFVIEIVSEAGDGKTGASLAASGNKNYYTEYHVQIERSEANTDADLLDVALNDQDGQPLKMFAFHRDETSYRITVPYAARSVSFTAQTSDANATIQLKDHENLIHSTGLSLDEIISGRPSKLYALNAHGSPRTFDLIVTAEDGKTTKTYTLIIDREPPSTDALLKKLVVDGLTEDGLTPIFKPHDTDYSGIVAEGAEGIRITPTANDKNATIMVNGFQVDSGETSELVELLEVQTKLEIVVTAEDGVTKMTYILDLYNQNLVDKTNNADLSSLRVERGVMTPEFKAAVTEYEVAVKEDTWSVDIIPKPDDPLAEIKVLNGTREIGDYNGNYGLALQDGENQLTVRVTSPDKTQVKDYNITIYRNQEDGLKTLTPLTADDVDFENSENPIIISISEYPRIESSVFNALKEYPEKTIIFQGLDYSLTFQASNLNTVIPTREIYDFRLSFESLDADEIRAYMGQWAANADIMDDLVMIYFDYHGDLPGPAMLNLKLGNKYGAQTLFWHYYNRERKLIEFYGTVRSNSQGSISVPINHFSTYLLTRNRMITGAENYGNTLSQIRATIGPKQNPTTGAAADETSEDGA